MRIVCKWLAALLLMVNGVGAIAAGSSFVARPDGSGIGMPISVLHGTPFADFLVPGIILLVCNGVFSLLALLCLALGWGPYAWLVLCQGLLLVGWVAIQVLLIGFISPLQPLFLFIGLAIAVCGSVLARYKA